MAFATSQNTDQLLTRGLAFRLPNNAPISTTFTLYANGAGQTYWSNSLNPSALSTLSTTIGDVSNITNFQSTQITDLYGQISSLSTGTATSMSSLSNYLLDYVNSSITGLSTFSTFYNDLYALSNQTSASLSTMSTSISRTNSTTVAFLTSSLTSSMTGMTLSSSGGLYRYINNVSAATVFYPTFYSTTNSLNRAVLSTSTGLNNQINVTNFSLSTNILSFRIAEASTNTNFFSTITGYGPRIGALESASTNTSTVTGRWISSQVGVSQSTQDAMLNARFQQLSTYVSTIAIFATAQFGSLSSLSSALYTSIVANNSTNDTQNAQISTLARNLSILTTSSILAGVYDTFIQLENYTVGLINSTIAFTYYWQSSLFISTFNQNTLLSEEYFSTFTGTAYLSTLSATTALNEAFVSTYSEQLYSTSLSEISANNSTQISVLYSTGYQFLTSSLVSSLQAIPAPLRSTVVFIGFNAASTNQGEYGIAVGFNAGRVDQLSNSVAIGNQAGSLYQAETAVAIGYLAGRSSQGIQGVAIGPWCGEVAQARYAVAIGNFSGQYNQGEDAVAIGDSAGNLNQGETAVAIGVLAGNTNQGSNAVAIGTNAGVNNMGSNAIAIGKLAGQDDQAPNTIVINASGTVLNTSTISDCLYIAPIRNDETLLGGFLHYDPMTKEIVFNDQGGSGISKNSTFTQPVYMSTINTLGASFLINTQIGSSNIDYGTASFFPLLSYPTTGLSDVVACSASGQIVLFLKTDGTYGVSTDYGSNFTFDVCPTSPVLNCAMDETGTYMINTFHGGDNSFFYVSNNVGTSFTAFNRPYGFSGGVDYSPCAVSASGQYMAIVGTGNPSGTTVLVLSTDFGFSWNRNLSVPTLAGSPRSCSISDDGQTIIIGFLVAAGNNATYTTDGGASWTSITIGGGGTNYLYSLTMTGDASRFLAGTSNSGGNSGIYTSTNPGLGFTAVETSPYAIQSVALNRPTGQFMIAGVADTYGSVTYFTSKDFGATWSPYTTPVGGDWYSFAVSDDGVYTYSVPLTAPGIIGGPYLLKMTSAPTLTARNVGINSLAPTATLDISGSLAFSTINVPRFFVEVTDPNSGISIGSEAGLYNPGSQTIAIGVLAGQSTQQTNAIAIGFSAGQSNQGEASLAIGPAAGGDNQGPGSVAIGGVAGSVNQGRESVAIGSFAGSLSQGSCNVAIGRFAGYTGQANFAVAVGQSAGLTNQSGDTVAVGNFAGNDNQAILGVAIGSSAGGSFQGSGAVAVGNVAGYLNQGQNAVAVGIRAGSNAQSQNAVAVGFEAGRLTQGANAVALGNAAGQLTQGTNAVALGVGAGTLTQGNYSVAIGGDAGSDTQGSSNVAIGWQAGYANQSNAAVAVGTYAGNGFQGSNAVAIGNAAGNTTQGCNAIAIGPNAGFNTQGNYAIAIGNQAGETTQNANSIVLNASNTALNTAAAGFYVNPVRSNAAITGGFVHYDAVNKELVYNEAGGSVSSFNNIFFSTATGVSTVSRAARFNILNASTIGGFSPITFTDSIIVLGSTVTSNFFVSGNFTTAGPTNTSSIRASSITTNVLNASTVNTSSITAARFTLNSASIRLGESAGATNQGNFGVAIGFGAGCNTQLTGGVAVGYLAANSGQAANAVAIGTTAGFFGQSTLSVAIGTDAGYSSQNSNAVAIGPYAGRIAQGVYTVGVGFGAGSNAQGNQAIALGLSAGTSNQGNASIAVGWAAARNFQGTYATAIGYLAGDTRQGGFGVALGHRAGFNYQSTNAIAIGNDAGFSNQNSNAVAIGNTAGRLTQGLSAVAVGNTAGNANQGNYATAIGPNAGVTNQGAYAVAIGFGAGTANQNPSSIIINASATALNATASGFFVNPVRSNAAIAGGFVHYDAVNKELVFNEVGALSQLFVSTVMASTLATTTASVGLTAATASVGLALQVGNKVVLDNNFNYSNAPFMAVISTPTSATVLNDVLPVIHLARQGTASQSWGARATLGLSRFDNSGTNSRTRLDFQLANGMFDTANVMTMRSDGRVGINISTPQFTLDVNGTLNVASNATFSTITVVKTAGLDDPQINIFGDAFSNFTSDSSRYSWGQFAINSATNVNGQPVGVRIRVDPTTGTNGTTSIQSINRFTVTAPLLLNPLGGFVGINISTPQYALDVNRDARISSILYSQQLYTDVVNPEFHTIIGYNNANTFWGSYAWFCSKQTIGQQTASTLTLFSYANSRPGVASNVLSISPSANVGIRTTAPQYTLDVAGTTRINGNLHLGPNPNITTSGTGGAGSQTLLAQFASDGNSYIRNMSSSGALFLGASNQNNITITQNGLVGINAAPTNTLTVHGNTATNLVGFINTNGGAVPAQSLNTWNNVLGLGGISARSWDIGIETQSGTAYSLGFFTYGNSNFSGTRTLRGYINGASSANLMNFTGQHRCFPADDLLYPLSSNIGKIVIASGQYQSMPVDGSLLRGISSITIAESLPLVTLTRNAKDKRCFGVVCDVEDFGSRSDSYGSFVTPYTKTPGDTRIFINSVGEGAIWVCDINGSVENGDYITTSDVPGFGMKQDEEYIANYTVAKITMSCDFNPPLVPKQVPLMSTISGVSVPVLDNFSTVVWANSSELEPQYKLSFINSSGETISQDAYTSTISGGGKAYRAAFVGCTYHCG